MSYKNALIDWFSKLLHVAAIVSHTFHHIFKFIVATAAYRLFLLINRQNMLFVFHERYNWDIGMGNIFISLIRTLCEILSVEFFIYLLKIDSKNNTFELRTFKLMKISKKKSHLQLCRCWISKHHRISDKLLASPFICCTISLKFN